MDLGLGDGEEEALPEVEEVGQFGLAQEGHPATDDGDPQVDQERFRVGCLTELIECGIFRERQEMEMLPHNDDLVRMSGGESRKRPGSDTCFGDRQKIETVLVDVGRWITQRGQHSIDPL